MKLPFVATLTIRIRELIISSVKNVRAFNLAAYTNLQKKTENKEKLFVIDILHK